jgi:hypothetical protein
MKQRPFLLIQSDAVLKELAHMENRVNTYVKQLEQGLHAKLAVDDEEQFEIRTLDELVTHQPLTRETDVICLPTMADNRMITAVFRGAGYICIDNYSDDDYDLPGLVKSGRKAAGQAVCAPLAAMYADLEKCVDQFARRKRAGDPALAGKKRLVLIDTQGPGPCRQGQYPGLHRLFFHKSAPDRPGSATCNSLPAGAIFEFMLLNESEGYRGGFEEWVMLRIYQGAILKDVLQGILFTGAAACHDYDQYLRFMNDFRALQAEIYGLLESYTGPGPLGRKLLGAFGGSGWASLPLKYFLYRLHGKEFSGPLRRFVSTWIDPDSHPRDNIDILISGEGYLRISQAEEIFRNLLGAIGFRRFKLELSPMVGYLECLLEEAADASRCELEVTRTHQLRNGKNATNTSEVQQQKRKLRTVKFYRFLLRKILARPMYKASRLPIPLSAQKAVETSRELLPTYRPIGELSPYIGEALAALREGVDVVLNVAPNGCMVSSMGEVLTSRIMHAAGVNSGRIQTLLSAEGDVDQELLTLSVLKAIGPQLFLVTTATAQTPIPRQSDS